MSSVPEVRLDHPIQVSSSARIAAADTPYYARYFGDPISRLFWHEDALWLSVLPQHSQFFNEFYHSPLFEELVTERLLIGLEAALLYATNADAVYRLAFTPRITYWHEWSPKMWRSAALHLLALMEKLAAHQLTLRNPHPWNLLYNGQGFVYINPGSVVPLKPEAFARSYEKIARFFLRPLLLSEHGYLHIAKRLAEDPRDGALVEDIQHLAVDWVEWHSKYGIREMQPFLQEVRTRVSALACNPDGERWVDYFATDCDFSANTSWSRKQRALEAMLEDHTIESVLDLGANTGHYARVAARHGREAIAADFDLALIDKAFLDTRSSGLAVYPVVSDFSHPTPGQGVDNAWFPPATARLKCDLVLCFALSHHMVFGKYRLDFEQVARGIRSFSRRWALVEYVERGKIRPEEWRPDADAWYTVDDFAASLNRHFPAVQALPPAKDGRRLLVCGPERRLV